MCYFISQFCPCLCELRGQVGAQWVVGVARMHSNKGRMARDALALST